MTSDAPVTIELGCGRAKRNPNAIGVDILDLPGVDVVCDAADYLSGLPQATVAHIYSEHFLEHVDNPLEILRLAALALIPGGTISTVVPHFSNPYFYSDPTHRSFFGLYTMSYWAEDRIFRRRVPHYTTPIPLVLESVHLRFKSTPPFYVRHAFKRAIEGAINMSTWSQEFYEENLSCVLPCYEVAYAMRRAL